MWERLYEAAVYWMLSSGVTIVVALCSMIVVIILVRFMFRRLRSVIIKVGMSEENVKRVDTIVMVLRQLSVGAVVVIGLLIVLAELGIDMAPLLTAVGIVGLALSFGAQSLVKDVISGFFILLENQVRVNDYVKIGDCSGIVEAIGLRFIRLRDPEGRTHIIPNGAIETITNLTKDFSRAILDIGVSYREDVDRVIAVLEEIGREVREDPDFGPRMRGPVEVFGLEEFADSAVVIRMRITTDPIKQWELARELRKRIKKRFDAEGIEFPFPHRTIYWGEPKPGMQQGLRVSLERQAD